MDTNHIILIEDDDADAELFVSVASDLCSDIRRIKDGEEAVQYFSNPSLSPPDVVFLDLNMPKLDGRQILSFLRSEDRLRRIPVVVLTSSKSERDVDLCYENCANIYIVKPLDLADFTHAVTSILTTWFVLATIPTCVRD